MKKGIVLVVVVGIMLVMITLGLIASWLMTQKARVAEHKIRRMRAFFAAQAGIVHALEEIRKGNNPSAFPAFRIGANILGYPVSQPGIIIGMAVNIIYNPNDDSGPGRTRPVTAAVDYTFPLFSFQP